MKKAPMTNGKSAVVDDSHFFDDVSEEAKKLAKKEKNRTQAANKKQAKIPEVKLFYFILITVNPIIIYLIYSFQNLLGLLIFKKNFD